MAQLALRLSRRLVGDPGETEKQRGQDSSGASPAQHTCVRASPSPRNHIPTRSAARELCCASSTRAERHWTSVGPSSESQLSMDLRAKRKDSPEVLPSQRTCVRANSSLRSLSQPSERHNPHFFSEVLPAHFFCDQFKICLKFKVNFIDFIAPLSEERSKEVWYTCNRWHCHRHSQCTRQEKS